MGRLLGFLYGVANYVFFLAIFLYLVVFIGNITEVAGISFPKTIDYGGPQASTFFSGFVINVVLLALFGIQHTVMARQWFKKAITKTIPKTVERGTFVLMTNLLLVLIYWQWRPLPEAVWTVGGVGGMVLQAGFWIGVLLVLVSTFLIDHFELFGLKQAFYHLRGKEMPPYKFVTPWFYKYVRHPLYVGWLLMFWCAPVMSRGHLLLAAVWTGYILIAIRHEERDLIAHFGKKYEDYRKSVPMLIPFLKPRGGKN